MVIEFRCPVCRARQSSGDQCRRCAADLGLVHRCWQRCQHLLAEAAQAQVDGDQVRFRRAQQELQRLSPRFR